MMKARETIAIARIAAEAAGAVVPELVASGRVQRVIDRAEGGLQAVDRAIQTGDPAAIADAGALATGLAGELLGPHHPATEVLGDAVAGFSTGLGATALLGLGGPVGLIAAIGLGAFQALRKGNENFERWKARVLDRPFTANLFPPGPVDGGVALSALEAAPIFTRALLDPTPAEERRVRAIRIAESARLDPTAAKRELYDADPGRFASEDEFQAGLQEFRHALLDGLLGPDDPEPVDISRAVDGTQPITQRALGNTVRELRRDPATGKGLDTALLLITSLATRTDMTEDRMIELLRGLLPGAQQVAAQAQREDQVEREASPTGGQSA
jgi:hypothetical protein